MGGLPGKVWMVTMMMGVPLTSASTNWADLLPSPSSRLMREITPDA